jgi:hypothetical protein
VSPISPDRTQPALSAHAADPPPGQRDAARANAAGSFPRRLRPRSAHRHERRIDALKSGRLGALAIDVYEEEEGVFYEDLSNQILADDQLARLLTFPNVLVTSHQAFFTREAMEAIAAVTLVNLDAFAAGGPCANLVPTA